MRSTDALRARAVRARRALVGLAALAGALVGSALLLAPAASAVTAAPAPGVLVAWRGALSVSGGTAAAPDGAVPAYTAPAGTVSLTNHDTRSVLLTVAPAGSPQGASYRIIPGTVYAIALPAGTFLISGDGPSAAGPRTVELRLVAASSTPTSPAAAPAAVPQVLAPTTPPSDGGDPLLAALAPAQYTLVPDLPDTAPGGVAAASAPAQSHPDTGLGRSAGLAATLAVVALVGAVTAYVRVMPALGVGAAFTGGLASRRRPRASAHRRPRTSTAAPLPPAREPAAGPEPGSAPTPVPPRPASQPVAAGPRVVVIPTVGERPLGRHVEHDERSRAYPVPLRPDAGRAVSYVRRTPVFHQGHLASSTATALLGWLGTDRRGARGVPQEADAVPALYALATALDAIPGAYPERDTGSSALGVMKAARRQGLISSYRHAFTLDQALSGLATGPVLSGTLWYSDMDHPEFDGRVRIGGTVRGGHEYLVVGYDPATGLLECCNSWGRAWGHRGRFFLALEDWRTLLAKDGDVTVPVV